MSIADLIQAAEYIERRDRVFFVAESEHGYALNLPACEERSGGRRPKTKKSQGSRTTHNELEKNRWTWRGSNADHVQAFYSRLWTLLGGDISSIFINVDGWYLEEKLLFVNMDVMACAVMVF
ncbi:unnamed protein product [Colias eurytheme]|nr:unnamed protein product [Colias eurytheme]